MGYYTTYSLEVIGEEVTIPKSFIEEANKYGIVVPTNVNHEVSIGELSKYGNPFEGECSWYEHDEDMKAYSKQYPTLIFKISGEGEESGDIWVKYYKDGKVQECKAKVTYDEFDESKLK
jgi:hypothetical protein